MDQVGNILLFIVLPPVMGAIIGYVTNHIAIKMLFRPLTEKRLFGIRLPLTPGIIPKQRYVLAESIGNMVSRQLITEESFRNQVASTGFQERVAQSIAGFTHNLLQTPLATLTREKQKEMYDAIEKALAHFLKQFFDSPDFPVFVKQFIAGSVGYLLQHRLEDFLRQETVVTWLEAKLYPRLTAGETRTWLLTHIRSWLREKLAADLPLKEFITAPVVDFLIKLIESLYPHLTDSLLGWLRSPEVRAELRQRGSLLLIDALNKLNVFQKFFVSLAQYDKTLDEKMPAIIDDALNHIELSLNRIENKEALLNAARKAIDQWRQKSLKDFLEQTGVDADAASERLLSFLFNLFTTGSFKNRVTSSLLALWEKYKAYTLRDLCAEVLNLKQEEITGFLFKTVHGYLNERFILQANGTAELANGLVSSFSSYLEQQAEHETIQSLLVIRENHKTELDSYLCRFLLNLIEKNVPRIIESLNVKQLVVNKINQLDILQVENLLLMVIAKQLKWIDVFGAFLGGILGLVQVVFNLIR